MRVTVVFACLLVGSAAIGQSPQCGMSRAFDQLDQDGQSKIAVWNDGPGAALLFADTMNINTDGTRRSYSVDDFWGENHALNNLCNAMSDKCAGLTSDQMRDRRIATQKAKADGWPRAATNATRISKSIISFKGGKPCPEIDGYLVSATALHKARIIDPCDISNYADALTVPSIVLPQRAKESIPTLFEAAGAKLGDLVVTMSADGRLIHYAVVGDSGPSKSLGEVSLALASELNGRRLPPDNYLEVRGRKPYVGKGWHVGRTFTLILTRTRDAANPYMTRERIEKAAAEWFAKWGGDGRLKACSAMYRS